MSREELMDVLIELPYCVAKPGRADIPGVGNYLVAIEKPTFAQLEVKVTDFKEHRNCHSTMVSGHTQIFTARTKVSGIRLAQFCSNRVVPRAT